MDAYLINKLEIPYSNFVTWNWNNSIKTHNKKKKKSFLKQIMLKLWNQNYLTRDLLISQKHNEVSQFDDTYLAL